VAFLSPASPEQITEILDATFPLWGEGLDRAGYERYNAGQLGTSWGRHHLHRLVLQDGARWLATAKRYDLCGRLDGREVRIMGIGAVFTPSPLRRQGHAAELIRRMLDQAEGEGVDLALLFSEIGPHFYARLGFHPVPLTQLALRIDGLGGPPGIAIRSGEARDLAAVSEMNRMQADGFRFAMVRSPE
jgi:GNAT superfamily N-acetyltransferase